jgi:hypothetical protein
MVMTYFAFGGMALLELNECVGSARQRKVLDKIIEELHCSNFAKAASRRQ